MTFQRFEDIEAWQRGRELARLIYELTGSGLLARDFTLRDQLRRAAVSLLYEAELRAAEEPDALEERFVDLYGDALGIRHFASRFLDGLEQPYEGALWLRTELFAGQLESFLAREYDEDWFRSARAGRFLVDRWREGQRYTAEELARFLGFEGLDVAPLIERLRAAIVD